MQTNVFILEELCVDLHTRVGVFVAVHKEEFPISHQQIIIRAKRYLGT